jgi:hypothetical protein
MIIFVFAQMNAIPCIGEQDKKKYNRENTTIDFCVFL